MCIVVWLSKDELQKKISHALYINVLLYHRNYSTDRHLHSKM